MIRGGASLRSPCAKRARRVTCEQHPDHLVASDPLAGFEDGSSGEVSFSIPDVLDSSGFGSSTPATCAHGDGESEGQGAGVASVPVPGKARREDEDPLHGFDSEGEPELLRWPLEPPPATTDSRLVALSWARRRRRLLRIAADPGAGTRLQRRAQERERFNQREQRRRRRFLARFADKRRHASGRQSSADIIARARRLRQWLEQRSFCSCVQCGMVQAQKLKPADLHSDLGARFPLVAGQVCCSVTRGLLTMPAELKGLTRQEILLLRPIDLYQGPKWVHHSGYRCKTGPTHLRWHLESVSARTQAATLSRERRAKVTAAYRCLLALSDSAYGAWIRRHERWLAADLATRGSRSFGLWGLTRRHVECALWPHLYVHRNLCETGMQSRHGQASSTHRASTAASFLQKARSIVLDYSTSYDLLQFQYDLWLWKACSGAVGGAQGRCKTWAALDQKPFSPTYWHWELRYLVDLVDQFDRAPDVFLTIAPSEYRWPLPQWVRDAMSFCGLGPTKYAFGETLSFATGLQEIVRSVLAGSGGRFTQHVFRDQRGRRNVEMCFYRFEFQQRGTLHMHALVWLHDLGQSCLAQELRADIPWEDEALAWAVWERLKSNVGHWRLPQRSAPTAWVRGQGERPRLALHHPAEAKDRNLRCYAEILIRALDCHVDVDLCQTDNFVAAYTAKYASKARDAMPVELAMEALKGWQVAQRFLQHTHPLEPEMWLRLSSVHECWSEATRRRLRPSLPACDAEGIIRVSEARKRSLYYWYLRKARGLGSTAVSFRDYVASRAVVPGKEVYRCEPAEATARAQVAVGIAFAWYGRDTFFGQWLQVHVPHGPGQRLRHPRWQELPTALRWFASALHKSPEHWAVAGNTLRFLRRRGVRWTLAQNLLERLAAQRYLLGKVLGGAPVLEAVQPRPEPAAMDHYSEHSLAGRSDQREVYEQFCAALRRHCALRLHDLGFDASTAAGLELIAEAHLSDLLFQRDRPMWPEQRLRTAGIAIAGSPGSGKSHVMNVMVAQTFRLGGAVTIACPQALQACKYRELWPQAHADTVHSLFGVPRDVEQDPWSWKALPPSDLVLMEEFGMVTDEMFDHAYKLWRESGPESLLVAVGDPNQLPALETAAKQTRLVPGANRALAFRRHMLLFELRGQARFSCPVLERVCAEAQNAAVSRESLQALRRRCISVFDPKLNRRAMQLDRDVQEALRQSGGQTVFLCDTNRGAYLLGRAVVRHLYGRRTFLGSLEGEAQQDFIYDVEIYQDMPLLITENLDKEHELVNGAVVHAVHYEGTFLIVRTASGYLHSLYRRSRRCPNGERRAVFPVEFSGAMTVHKAQGMTLEHMTLWVSSRPGPGVVFTALSRVRTIESLLIIDGIRDAHFQRLPLLQR